MRSSRHDAAVWWYVAALCSFPTAAGGLSAAWAHKEGGCSGAVLPGGVVWLNATRPLDPRSHVSPIGGRAMGGGAAALRAAVRESCRTFGDPPVAAPGAADAECWSGATFASPMRDGAGRCAGRPPAHTSPTALQQGAADGGQGALNGTLVAAMTSPGTCRTLCAKHPDCSALTRLPKAWRAAGVGDCVHNGEAKQLFVPWGFTIAGASRADECTARAEDAATDVGSTSHFVFIKEDVCQFWANGTTVGGLVGLSSHTLEPNDRNQYVDG
eukprot:gene31861-43177_t